MSDIVGQYLTFDLGGEELGIAILHVHEIVGILPITPIPGAPPHVRGVVNLRGRVIPVMSLREKFGMDARGEAAGNCIVIVESDARLIGITVDGLHEVVHIAADEIGPVPGLAGATAAAWLRGIANVGGRVRLLLDLDRVLADEQALPLDLDAATFAANPATA